MSQDQANFRPCLLSEVGRFRAWASSYPFAGRSGEWECEYEDWCALHKAVSVFIEGSPVATWSEEEFAAVLYVIARDNETQYLSRGIRERVPMALLDLAEAALRIGEAEAKWQFAEELGHFYGEPSRRNKLLLSFARDDNEYVRRRSLQALARIGSAATEAIALEAWSRHDESQEYARMMALWALHRIGSSHLTRLLHEAAQDNYPHLAAYALKVENDDVNP